MSLDLGIGQIVTLTQLAWDTFQNSKKAGDVYSQISQELGNLHMILKSLRNHADHPRSLLNQKNNGALKQLEVILTGCDNMLEGIDSVLSKYSGLSKEKMTAKKFGLMMKFGNTDAKDVSTIRDRIASYTSSITAFLGVLAVNSLGKAEENASYHMLETKEFRKEFRAFAALQKQNSRVRDDVTVFTTHTNDDKNVWREFRRKAIKNGYSSNFLDLHMLDLLDYMEKSAQDGSLNPPKLQDNDDQSRQRLATPSKGHSIHRTASTQSFQNLGDDISPTCSKHHLRQSKSSRQVAAASDDETTIAEQAGRKVSSPRRETNYADVDDWLTDYWHAVRPDLFPRPAHRIPKPNSSVSGTKPNTAQSKGQDKTSVMRKERYGEPPPPMYNQDDSSDDESPRENFPNRRRANAKNKHRSQREKEKLYSTVHPSGRKNHVDPNLHSNRRYQQTVREKDQSVVYASFSDSDAAEDQHLHDADSTSSEYTESEDSDDSSGDDSKEESRFSRVLRPLRERTHNMYRKRKYKNGTRDLAGSCIV